MKKAQETKEAKEAVQEELQIKYAIHDDEVIPCIFIGHNPFTREGKIGINPVKHDKNIIVKETIIASCEDVFDTESEAELALLKRKQERLADTFLMLNDKINNKEKKVVKVLLYLLAFDITLLIGFCLLAAGVK